jgi:hypothetical protein
MAVLPPVSEFEVRLHKADGTLSIIMTINAFGPDDAKLWAVRMLKDDLAYAIIWHGLVEVATVHRNKPN